MSRRPGYGLPESQAAHVKVVLKKLREVEESNAALARRLALDPATVGRVLGGGAPSIHVANAVAEHLGVEVGEVLEGRAQVPVVYSPGESHGGGPMGRDQ